MNLFLDYQEKIYDCIKSLAKKKLITIPKKIKGIVVELPPPNLDADISCNAALILSGINKKNPEELAKILKSGLLLKFHEFEDIIIAKPGFLNIKFKSKFWENYLKKVIIMNHKYGSLPDNKKKINIEFVSANPTGPLHVGHCRGAVLGDTLSNILSFNGNKVIKEYYVNDYGGQIINFVNSVYHRIMEIKKKIPFPDDKDLYPGDYIKDIAQKIVKKKLIKNFNNFNNIKAKLTSLSLKYSMEIINKNLKLIGVKHNNFIYESDLIKKKIVLKTINNLKKKKHIYVGELDAPKGELSDDWKKRDQLLFRSTNFGDDLDRPVQKKDGSWTYFAGDLGYHSHKVSRKFDILINILGADHSGYVKRIVAGTKAISDNKTTLICKVSQLVKLKKKGEPFKMSKRKGDYITVEDLVKEVGKDSVRFMMLSRSNDVELDFDFEKVTEKSKDNPVFYVQYAYARINSVFKLLKLNLNKKIKLDSKKFKLNYNEIQILKKISEWPKCIDTTSKKLEPHRIPFYLYDLVTLFHAYWNLGKENKEFRFISDDGSFNKGRLKLLQALSIVIKNGMSILGVSTPVKM